MGNFLNELENYRKHYTDSNVFNTYETVLYNCALLEHMSDVCHAR